MKRIPEHGMHPGRSVRDRLKASAGTSIGEMLVTVLILLLSTSILVAVMSLGVRTFIDTLARSEANMLSSTLQAVMTDELAYTTEVQVADASAAESNVNLFLSQNYVMAKTLSTFFVSGDDDYGKVMIGTETSSFKLLGDGSYPHNLGVQIKKFTYNRDNGIFTLEITIGRNSKEYLDQTFQVVAVNNITVKAG